METGSEFKSILNRDLVNAVGKSLAAVDASFKLRSFVQAVMTSLEDRELKDRAIWIAEQMHAHLPDDLDTSIRLLTASLGEESRDAEMSGFSSFFYMPHGCFIERYGLDHYDLSMNAMAEITKRFTSEFAIRPFITAYPDACMKQLMAWTTHENTHIRRLVTEGTRPRLPWASRLPQFQKDPSPVIALLEKLKADPELYVRRSVANNLNDISKDNPEVVIRTLKKWSRSRNKGTQWIIGHALRTLVKQGNPDALELLGYPASPSVKVSGFKIETPCIAVGESLHFTVTIQSTASAEQSLMIDYVMHYMKSNGKQAPKVFKLKKVTLQPGERITVTHRKSFKLATTRKLYAGSHAVELMINGNAKGKRSFELA